MIVSQVNLKYVLLSFIFILKLYPFLIAFKIITIYCVHIFTNVFSMNVSHQIDYILYGSSLE